MGKDRVFSTLSAEEENEILGQCKLLHISKGETLLKKDEPSTALYAVKSGRLRVVDEVPGKKMYLSTVGPNELFGEMSFLDEEPRSATVTAIEEAELYRMTKEDLLRLLLERPSLTARLLLSIGIMLVGRLRRADAALLSLSISPQESAGKDLGELIDAVKGKKNVKTKDL
jgi:CRP-like cAMP-binding protein